MQLRHSLLVILISMCAIACAHGTLEYFSANGHTYVGPHSQESPDPLPIDTPTRQIALLEPILSANITSADMTCGPGAASSASFVAPVTSGSTMSFKYRSGTDGTKWPHNTGPILTYMYKCPHGTQADTCTPPRDAGWFKIDEKGYKPDGTTWWQKDLQDDKQIDVVLPHSVPDGDFLLRFEVLALQNAVTRGSSEFYVSCTQIRVSGGGGGEGAAGAQLVAFPGAYTEDDPGVFVPQLYSGFFGPKDYTFPGPPVLGASAAVATVSSPSSSQISKTSSPATQKEKSSAAPHAAVSSPSRCAGKQSKRAARRRARLVQGRLNPSALRY